MKTIAIGAVIAGLAVATAFAQGTGTQGTAATVAAPQKGLVCLWINRIGATKAAGPDTVLFYMKDGKVWKNSLKTHCPFLKTYGFTFRTDAYQICSNQQVLFVLKTGDSCVLGDFVPYTPPQKEAPPRDRM